MSVHFENLSRLFRCYAPGDSYEAGSEPIAIGTVCRRDSGEVEIMATMGELCRQDLRDLIAHLRDDGVHTICIKRRSGHRVPFGHLVKSDGRFDTYELTIADLEAP